MKLATLLLTLLTISPTAIAGGLDPRRVPADARWVTHIDLEAIGRSKFLRALSDQGQDFTREFDLDRVQTTFGVDPRKDLTGLTFFNASKNERDFVVIVAARPGIELPWSRLIERPHDTRRVGTRNVHGIGTDLNLLAASVNDSQSKSRLFVLATSEAAMAEALIVLDGDAPNLSAATAPGITARPASEAIVFAAGSAKSPGSPFMVRSVRILREFAALERAESDVVELNAQGLVFEFGEERDDLYLRLELDTVAEKNAADVGKVLGDALARVTKLASGSDAVPQIERLANAVRIETQAAHMRASFRYGAAAFVNDVLRSEKMMGVTKAR